MLTTASAPQNVPIALSNAAVGSGTESLVAIAAGQAVSNAILIPKGPDTGVGAVEKSYDPFTKSPPNDSAGPANTSSTAAASPGATIEAAGVTRRGSASGIRTSAATAVV